MVFPIGEWLLFSVGILAWLDDALPKSLRVLPFAWFGGWVIEYFFTFSQTWNWFFPRIFVLIVIGEIAWERVSAKKIAPMFLAGGCLVIQDLFTLNEPGIFAYDQWLFAFLFVLIAYLSSINLWGMVLSVSGGLLWSSLVTMFLFHGVVNYYEFPNDFLWHFAFATVCGLAFLKLLKDLSFKSIANDKKLLREDD